jgi:hypothetical protein
MYLHNPLGPIKPPFTTTEIKPIYLERCSAVVFVEFGAIPSAIHKLALHHFALLDEGTSGCRELFGLADI